MEETVPKPPTDDPPAIVMRPQGCICRDCGGVAPCDTGETRDHRFTCATCLRKR